MDTTRKVGRAIALTLAIPAMLLMWSGPASADEDQAVFTKATSGYGTVGEASHGEVVKATAGYGEAPLMDQASTVKATGGYGPVRPTDGRAAADDPSGTLLPWALVGLSVAALLVAVAIGGRRRQRRLAIA